MQLVSRKMGALNLGLHICQRDMPITESEPTVPSMEILASGGKMLSENKMVGSDMNHLAMTP